MAHRPPSQPPVLSGYDYRFPLGTGGFADVFLYEQDMPRRSVAVKVLLSNLVDSDVLRMFNAEADVMAKLSPHPSILTVHAASISADGRPYLVMEYCPSPLIRRDENGISERVAVDRALHVAIKMASALETAHRAGVLHRDIKPSNILLTAFGAPVLGDFGIATSLASSHHEDVFAMSVPWSAPEVLNETTTGTVQSEVWSLAATVYTLLAGHAPFEKPDRSENSRAKQRMRIIRERPRTLPADIPDQVQRILMRAMSKSPEARQQSMLALARELQQAQTDLGLPITPLELAVDEWAPQSRPEDFGNTRVRGAVVSIVPVESSRTRAKQAHVGRIDTGGNTIVASRGETDSERSRPSPATVAGIVGGATAVVMAATAVWLVYAGVF
ncbi:serine/threonine-protein kinase [Gryllotalpicola protaetiae]|uniref:non-specific serine/threonine protein kinase n=1 Tax=Gryllotalpicola protaetiae TaxID=2419771 RepID=A0A387BPS7_9MICO|nr:serine/threonine-protein kinase [Gryllotalpicola protaetiae]AYG03017.1 serine/threonine protein kinase [Gryllotalpicola protaetiae]